MLIRRRLNCEVIDSVRQESEATREYIYETASNVRHSNDVVRMEAATTLLRSKFLRRAGQTSNKETR